MADLRNLNSCQLSNLDETTNQLMISLNKSMVAPSIISFSDPAAVDVDNDELKQVDQFHGEVLEKPGKLISCGSKSSKNANKPSSTDSSCDMPEHLLFDILLWLPVITLLRFKSICKSWYALIGNPIFIAQHLDHNSDKDNLLGLVYLSDDDDYGVHVDDEFRLLRGNKYDECNSFDCGQFDNIVGNPYISLQMSSNGIICLVYSDKQEVLLWNPALKQLRPLPKSQVSYNIGRDIVFFGFGYNVQSNDYKVVRIIGHEPYTDEALNEYTWDIRTNVDCVVEVYNLKADSWRTILNGALPFRYLKEQPISKNETCFWLEFDTTHKIYTNVVSFDLNDETFGTMPLPRNVGFFAALDFLDDKLAYICGLDDDHIYYDGPIYYEIWVMHEYGVHESWSKVWKIGPTNIRSSDGVYFPFEFTKNGDYLVLNDTRKLRQGQLYLYNLGTKENEYLELQQSNPDFYWFVRYTESLVSLERVVNEAY